MAKVEDKKRRKWATEVAASIASDLFTDGWKRHATRFVMEYAGDPKMPGTGLSKRAVADRIANLLMDTPGFNLPAGKKTA